MATNYHKPILKDSIDLLNAVHYVGLGVLTDGYQ